MNDVFVEQIIERKQDTVTLLKKLGIILAAILVSSVVLFIGMLRFIFPVTLALCCWAAYLMTRNMNLEYEYSYTNGEMDVDRIMGRRKRQRVLSVRVRQFDIMAPMTEEFKNEYESATVRRREDASSSPKSENRWFAKFTDNEGLMTMLIFEPNERLLDAITKLIPGKVKGRK